jgi:hypothetical protein
MGSEQILLADWQLANKKKDLFILALLVKKEGVLACLIQKDNLAVPYLISLPHKDAGMGGSSIQALVSELKGIQISECIIGLEEERMLIVPNQFESFEEIKQLFEDSFNLEPNEIIELQNIPWNNFVGIHVVKNNTKQIFTNLYANNLIINNYVALLNLYQHTLTNNNTVLLYYSSGKVAISYYANKLLQLHQVYEALNIDTVLYYLQKLITLKQILEPHIYIHGVDSSNLLAALQLHYASTKLLALPNGYMYSQNMDKDVAGVLTSLISIAKYAHH